MGSDFPDRPGIFSASGARSHALGDQLAEVDLLPSCADPTPLSSRLSASRGGAGAGVDMQSRRAACNTPLGGRRVARSSALSTSPGSQLVLASEESCRCSSRFPSAPASREFSAWARARRELGRSIVVQLAVSIVPITSASNQGRRTRRHARHPAATRRRPSFVIPRKRRGHHRSNSRPCTVGHQRDRFGVRPASSARPAPSRRAALAVRAWRSYHVLRICSACGYLLAGPLHLRASSWCPATCGDLPLVGDSGPTQLVELTCRGARSAHASSHSLTPAAIIVAHTVIDYPVILSHDAPIRRAHAPNRNSRDARCI